jgi:ferredoxin
MSIKRIFIPIFLLCGTVTAFIISVAKSDTDSPKINLPTPTISNSSRQKNVDKTASNPINLQKLSVLSLRCIGCGRCANIDPAHFEMNNRTEKSTVISSTNLNSQRLAMAINNCPVQAIVLE